MPASSILDLLHAPDGAAGAIPWSAAAAALGRQAVGKITIRTQVSPPIVIDPFAPAPPNPAPNPILSFVRPEIEISSPSGDSIVTLAPYGPPARNYFPWLIAGAAVFLVGLVTVVSAIARRIR